MDFVTRNVSVLDTLQLSFHFLTSIFVFLGSVSSLEFISNVRVITKQEYIECNEGCSPLRIATLDEKMDLQKFDPCKYVANM